ncbi:hypothetical protein ES705_22634 [subsurface metagenome]
MKIKLVTLKEIEEEEEKESVLRIKNEDYFSVKKLEQWLAGKAWNIRKYIRSGKVRGRKIKGKWFVSRKDFYRFLEGK